MAERITRQSTQVAVAGDEQRLTRQSTQIAVAGDEQRLTRQSVQVAVERLTFARNARLAIRVVTGGNVEGTSARTAIRVITVAAPPGGAGPWNIMPI